MPKNYDPRAVEAKWRKLWEDEKIYEADLKKANDPYYGLVMFPYPSGDKLHVGHWYNFAPADSFFRFTRMQGKDVFTPMGFDAFGLPAENYAIKTGIHPDASTKKNVQTMIEQLHRMGCMYDWAKMVNTSTPEYYRWTQWLFLQMFRNGLAYKKQGMVNWCPSCQTVLANEQVKEGTCERCGTEVIQKPLEQWFWKITNYCERLLSGLKDLAWPEKTKLMQRNWIGKSVGCDVSWKVEGSDVVLDTFTTTVDTIFGVTFVVISPEHPELLKITSKAHRKEVEKYIGAASKKTELDRVAETKDKSGVFTGSFVLHPFTGAKVPLWVADYVLMNYGTGVVMGVPAHDQRDKDFAEKYSLPIIQSIRSEAGESFVYDDVDKYHVKGTIVESGPFTGMQILEGRKVIIGELEKRGLGKPRIVFRLRDWLVSRQRYWGAPIPVVYDPEGKPHPVPEEHLPWLLPTDVEFKPTGKSPLTESKEFVARTEKIFGKGWRPEYDTMDTFVCSSFYELRYLMEGDPKTFIDQKFEKKWMPVSMYIGGPEHATMHLIYARFVMMALKDFGFVSHEEPFKSLVHQGLITHKGAKMSKSKGNVVSPDAFVDRYGADVFRMYLMFMGPFSDGGDWSDLGIKGIDRFVQRAWDVLTTQVSKDAKEDKEFQSLLHRTIKRVTDSISSFHFNTALSALMEFLNAAEALPAVSPDTAKTFTLLLAPLAPHLTEELWEQLGGKDFVINQTWPSYDKNLLQSASMTIAVQVNGKLRGTIRVPSDMPDAEVIAAAREEENVKKFLTTAPKKELYVKGRLVSFVV
ncbi:MAG: leucine--tRNA ligase [Candidatus Peribacteraceae bacterium]